MSQIILEKLGEENGKKYLEEHPYLKCKECEKWLNELYLRTKGKRGFSKKNLLTHISRLHLYLQFTKMTPTELIDEAEIDSLRSPRERINSTGLKIKNYFEYLKKEGRAPKTAHAYAMTVKGYYKHNGFPIQVYIADQQVVKGKIQLTKKILQKALYNTQKLRDKAIILIMVSSGMSIEDICDLQYSDVKEQLDAGEKPMLVRFARMKNNKNYCTFFSTECVNVLKQYLETERKGIKPRDHVFLNMKGRPLNYQAFRRILVPISRKTVGNNKVNTKSFRRFFNTEMRKAGIPHDWVEYMMGHETGNPQHYFNDGVLREMYEAKENTVTILTTVVREKAEDIRKEIEAKYQERFASFEKIVGQLQAQVASMNQRLGE